MEGHRARERGRVGMGHGVRDGGEGRGVTAGVEKIFPSNDMTAE